MALTLDTIPYTDNNITLKEFIEYCDANLDPHDHESVFEVSHPFQAISRNKKAILEVIHRDIESHLGGQAVRMYSSQSLFIHATDNYLFRLNLWAALSGDPRRRALDSRLYSYDRPHDHNFSFFTTGLAGPGYETVIYEYDRSKIDGFVGEKVEMEFLEKTTLPVGKVMFYRSGRDIHTQLPPDESAVSVNLMLLDRNEVKFPQYFFDFDKKEIDGIVGSRVGKRVRFFEMVGVMGDQNTQDLLTWFANKHECQKTRTAAKSAISSIEARGI